MVTFTPEQDAALAAVARWRKSGGKEFLLTGAAGTGKSTLAKAAGSNGTDVIYCSPTGKGADALRKRSGVPATTVHRALYKPEGAQGGKLGKLAEALLTEEAKTQPDLARVKRLRDELQSARAKVGGPRWKVPIDAPVKAARLVVVDECFMLSAQIIKDLLEHSRAVLFLGDPHQLPPVAGSCPLSDRRPDVHLEHIHRQALENPILAAATAVREGRPLPRESVSNSHGSYTWMPKSATTWEHYRDVDQIIVARNATRREMNRRYRARLGLSGLLSLTDRLMFLSNAHEMEIFNGSIAALDRVDDDGSGLAGAHELNVTMQCGRRVPAVPSWDGVIRGLGHREGPRDYIPVDYAYAVTGHKMQGSETDSILVYDEPFGDAEQIRRWRYTTLTRARTHATVVDTGVA